MQNNRTYSRNERFTCQQQPCRNMPMQHRQKVSPSCDEHVSAPCSCRIPRDPLEHMTLWHMFHGKNGRTLMRFTRDWNVEQSSLF